MLHRGFSASARYGNPGEVDAVVIWVITPPTF